MHDLSKLAWLSATLSVISFLLFVGLTIERTLALRRIKSNTIPPDPLATRAQAGFVEGAGKALEGAAKLTDSLAKAPLAVVALVGSLLFLMMGIGAASLDCESSTKAKPADSRPTPPMAPMAPTAPASTLLPGQRCVVRNFGDADGKLPAVLDDAPRGCFDRLRIRLQSGKLAILFLVGRCDVRELRPSARRIYTDNLTLAYQRAKAVQDALILATHGASAAAHLEIAEQAIILAAGAAHLSDKVNHGSNAEDRAVDLIPFWMETPTQ